MNIVPHVKPISNTRDRFLDRRSSTKKQNHQISTKKDSADLSPITTKLSRSGMDFENSFVQKKSSKINFNLTFKTHSFEKLSANGYYSEKSNTANVSFKYQFQNEVLVNGKSETHTFSAALSYTLSELKKSSISTFEWKEDIMSFIRDLLDDIGDVINDGDELAGVVFDYEALAEMAGINKGKFLEKLVQLIMMTVSLSQMKEMIEDKDPAHLVLLNPDRKVGTGIRMINESALISDFHFEIKDISKINNENFESLEVA